MLELIAQLFKRLAVNNHVICSVFKELCVTCSTASFDVIASSQEVILPESFSKVNTFVQTFFNPSFRRIYIDTAAYRIKANPAADAPALVHCPAVQPKA
jgi:hypothetical protein